MHTIQLELNDDLYDNIVENNINIQDKFKEFLHTLTDDGYPSISFNEAQNRVKNSIDDYKNNNDEYLPLNDEYWNNLENKINSL